MSNPFHGPTPNSSTSITNKQPKSRNSQAQVAGKTIEAGERGPPPPPPLPVRSQKRIVDTAERQHQSSSRSQESDAGASSAVGGPGMKSNPPRRQPSSSKTSASAVIAKSSDQESGPKQLSKAATTRVAAEINSRQAATSTSQTVSAAQPRVNPTHNQQQRQQQVQREESQAPAHLAKSAQVAITQQDNFQTGSPPQLVEDDLDGEGLVIGTADDEELIGGDSAAGGRGLSGLPPHLTVGLTRNLIYAVLASAVGSSFQHGYNGGVVNAPERLIGQFVNATYMKRHGKAATETQIDFIVAIIVSIFCIGGCFGALLTAFVADRMGRKEGLMYNNIMVLIAAPMMASSKAMSSYELLILGRFIIGINAGLNAGLAPLYLNEIAPVRLRGALGTIYQLVITISILLSNIFGLPSLLGDETSWPILFAIPIVPAAFMLAALPHCCESPKHLILNLGRELQAQQALAWLRQTGDVQEEMDELRSERELQAMNQRSISLGDMWYDLSLRKPMTIAIVIMLSQQLSGINAVLFYSTSIFRDAGLEAQAAVRATLGMGLVNVIMTLVSLFLVDRCGRRTLHMTGLMGMAATSLVLALCLSGDSTDRAPFTSGLAVVAVYVYIAMFASGPGAIPWFLVAELFPSNARPLASSIAVAVNWLANFTVSLCFLPLSNILHGFTFILFAVLLVIFYLFTYYKVPETKGATSDEISALFKR
uniref:Solute carrier family 2, facilitated glucose transporter member 1 n=1 Tax=Aceria tosichella TaxID=561515 RepID=A0A6G1SHP9_9ACAR